MDSDRAKRRAVFILVDNIGIIGMCKLMPPAMEIVADEAPDSQLSREWARAKRKALHEYESGELDGHYGDESIPPG